MKRFLCLAVALGAFCVLIAGASAAKDDYVNYDKRLPGFGAHITLVQSTKKSDTSHAINSPGNCDVKFICWIDAYISKTWIPVRMHLLTDPYYGPFPVSLQEKPLILEDDRRNTLRYADTLVHDCVAVSQEEFEAYRRMRGEFLELIGFEQG